MSYSYVITEEAAVNNDDVFEFGEYQSGIDQVIKDLIGIEVHFEN